ncbi:MAG: DNA mismatch repair protein MutS [Ruminococcus sp.]|nr:DNA mismatch repair protein MutS [Ruminococcus sp.]
MKYDEIERTVGVADLLYPSQEKLDALKKRQVVLEGYPGDYIQNLELEKIAEIISPHSQYRVMALFRQVCNDPEVTKFRCDILEDFLNVKQLAKVVREVIDIMAENDRRSLYKLDEPDCFDRLNDAVEAFEAYIRCIELMHEFFSEHSNEIKSEGITRLFKWFEDRYEDKHFEKLKNEISQLKDSIKNRIKSVTVCINLDDRLVPISAGIVSLSSEPYELKPSLLDKIIYHGARFPQNIAKNLKHRYVDNEFGEDKLVNTADKELFEQLDDLTECYVDGIDRALREYQKISPEELFALEYQLEFYVGAVKLIELCKSEGLPVCRPKMLDASERKANINGLYDLVYFNESKLWNLKHKDKKSVVTNDINFDDNARFFIITGANNGGKTTFIRAVGICQILAQTGLYVPCESCEISYVDFIYTHFPKEEQTGINSSRFTTEIKEFKKISDLITDKSLLLMNESIQSTTPQECTDAATELVKIFCMIGVRGMFATHLLDVAAKTDELNRDESLVSKLESLVARVDESTGERIYKIEKGKPTHTSRAIEIFSEFGIDVEAVKKRIKVSHK